MSYFLKYFYCYLMFNVVECLQSMLVSVFINVIRAINSGSLSLSLKKKEQSLRISHTGPYELVVIIQIRSFIEY